MSGNNGSLRSNNPSFLKLTRGIAGLLLGCPISSAFRIISRLYNGAPPQYVASYFAKYQPQLGNCSGGPWTAGLSPQISKTTLRTASGVLLSIVPMLGRPFGVGKGSAGRSISLGRPETSIVASVIGYENCPAHWSGEAPRVGHGFGKSKLCRDGLDCGSIPFGKCPSR